MWLGGERSASVAAVLFVPGLLACGPSNTTSSSGEDDDAGKQDVGSDAGGGGPDCPANLHGDDSTCGNGVVDAGELCFEPPLWLTPEGQYQPAFLAVGHANPEEDTDLDVVVYRDVFFGDGIGGFPVEGNIPQSTTWVAFVDVNGDGIDDDVRSYKDFDEQAPLDDTRAIAARLSPALGGMSYSTTAFPDRFAVGDLNGDGLGDIVYSGDLYWDVPGSSVRVVFQDPTSGFSEVGEDTLTEGGVGQIVDVDGDGDNDVLATGLFLGDGTGALSETPYPEGLRLTSIVQDYDCDGTPDATTIDPANGAIAVWRGSPGPVFEQRGSWAVDAKHVLGADINADGAHDVIASSGAALLILLGGADVTFAEPIAIEQTSAWRRAATGDFNGDGALDIVALTADRIGVFLSDP